MKFKELTTESGGHLGASKGSRRQKRQQKEIQALQIDPLFPFGGGAVREETLSQRPVWQAAKGWGTRQP